MSTNTTLKNFTVHNYVTIYVQLKIKNGKKKNKKSSNHYSLRKSSSHFVTYMNTHPYKSSYPLHSLFPTPSIHRGQNGPIHFLSLLKKTYKAHQNWFCDFEQIHVQYERRIHSLKVPSEQYTVCFLFLIL